VSRKLVILYSVLRVSSPLIVLHWVVVDFAAVVCEGAHCVEETLVLCAVETLTLDSSAELHPVLLVHLATN